MVERVTTLERTTFEMSRASEYFDVTELQKMTGLTRERFGEVVVKELIDNALVLQRRVRFQVRKCMACGS